MATKSITLTTEAYERLALFKEDNDSFSDVIKKITTKTNLIGLSGLLTKKEGKELKKNVTELREQLKK